MCGEGTEVPAGRLQDLVFQGFSDSSSVLQQIQDIYFRFFTGPRENLAEPVPCSCRVLEEGSGGQLPKYSRNGISWGAIQGIGIVQLGKEA